MICLWRRLDVSRELSDEEILEVIDELILNQSKELFFFPERKKWGFGRNCSVLCESWMFYRN